MQLREKAEKRCEECLSAEKEAKQRKEEASAAGNSQNMILAVMIMVLITAAMIFGRKVVIPGKNDRNAVVLLRAGKYEEAIKAFTAMGGYRDFRGASDRDQVPPGNSYSENRTGRFIKQRPGGFYASKCE
ncbi:MAG: hypothetical protein IKI84_03300 [Clostridia bacterium]|nr:hypothetical protein [Clostridia bacterium]